MLEICCASLKDALICDANNIKRIELNSSLETGGLTPFIDVVESIKNATKLKVIAMIRCRPGNFIYDNIEFELMKKQACSILKIADGIAFGSIDARYNIDENTTYSFIELCKKYNKEFVFHRAFDLTKNIKNIEILIKLGVNRILTSGLKPDVVQGTNNLREMQKQYGTAIEIIAGGGVRHDNILNLANNTGIRQFHGSFSKIIQKYSNNNGVDYGGYLAVDEEKLKAAIKNLQSDV